MKYPLDKLHLWDKNPRLIKDDRFKQLCKSIENDPEFMEVRPILATKDGKIYAGNMRYRAVKHLGWKEVPAILTDIDETLAKERAVKDNNQFGEWDDTLSTLLDELEKEGVDLDQLGLDESIQNAIQQLGPEVEEDEVPEVRKDPKTQLGDLWQLGNHRLLCGDATNVEDVERLMDGEKADMVFTDPPYNTQMQQGRHSKEWGIIENDNMSEESFKDFCTSFISTLYLSTKEGGHKYICMGWSAYNILYEAMPSVKTCIVWVKNNFGLGHGYRPQHEFILYDGGTLESNSESNVWDERKDASTEYSHPTQKPVVIPSRAIKNSSKQDQLVLDLFGGSGSTLIACEQLGRNCFMCEIDPKYVRVIIDRWENLTGEKAKLLK